MNTINSMTRADLTSHRRTMNRLHRMRSTGSVTIIMLLISLFQVVFCTVQSADAQSVFFIRAGASGSTCADWGNNACGSFPQFVAGATYYVADGSYGNITVNAANVTIKKATDSDYGGGANWQSSYGDGQAIFGTIFPHAHGVKIDGAKRNESNWADSIAYGFRIAGVRISTFDTSGVCYDNITVRYASGGGTASSPSSSEVLYMGGFHDNCDGWLIEKNLLAYHIHYTLVQAVKATNSTFQYNRFHESRGKEAIRGQVGFSGNTIRWNQFFNACGQGGGEGEGCTAEIAAWGETGSGLWDNNKIYGNWFYLNRDVNSGGSIVIGGNGTSWAGSAANNTLVYNNTFAGYSGGWMAGHILVNGGSGNICRNNLWYDVPTASASCNTTSNNVAAPSNPFVSYPSNINLHLSTARPTGYSLGNPYNMDMDGRTRGADGVWDIGAYEYGGSISSGLTPPAGLRILSP